MRERDTLAVVGCERNGGICWIPLIKGEELSAIVERFLGPIFNKLA